MASIYSKPIEQIEYDDLRALLDTGATENLRLEFKSLPPSRDELLKKVSGMANAFGGVLIVGAEEQRGTLSGLPGVPLKENYPQTVEQWCSTSLDPWLRCETSPAIPNPSSSDGDERFLYVIRVPESPLAPHFLVGRKGVYVRVVETSGQVQTSLAEHSELLRMVDRRKAVLERKHAAYKRFLTRADHFFGEVPGTPYKVTEPRLTFSISPMYPMNDVCAEVDLLKSVEEASLIARGESYPGSRSDAASQVQSIIYTREHYLRRLIEVATTGQISMGLSLSRQDSPANARGAKNPFGIDISSLLGELFLLISLASKWYSGRAQGTQFSVLLQLRSIRVVPVVYYPYGNGVHENVPGSPIDDSCEISEDLYFPEGFDPDATMRQVVKRVLYSLNLRSWVGSDEAVEKRVKAASDYAMIQR